VADSGPKKPLSTAATLSAGRLYRESSEA
jgi:hypothetical protein